MAGRKRLQFSSTMNNDYYEELKNISEETGVPISKLLDRAVQLLISDVNKVGIPRDKNIRTQENDSN